MLKINKVTKANDLNLRAYQLNRTEQLLVLSAISLIHPEDEDFKTYNISIKDFLNLLEIEDKSKYVELPKLTKGLMSKVIEIRKPHSLLHVTWFASAEHKQGEGIIEVQFSPKLQPYLLNLKDNFVTYGLNQVSKLSSKYSIRIYELLKGNEFKNQRSVQFELNDFREMVGIPEATYPQYSNLKQKVLLAAQREINESTDIAFEFEEIKVARKVAELKFFIKANKPQNNKRKESLPPSEGNIASVNENPLESKLEPLRAIMDKSITNLEIKKIYDAGKGELEKIIKVYYYAKDKEVNNLVGYVIGILKNGFSAPKKNIPKSKKDFDEREYNYDELEKKLLGWDK
jgi:plasmid replication initiation protein